jgi:hypothetical protein
MPRYLLSWEPGLTGATGIRALGKAFGASVKVAIPAKKGRRPMYATCCSLPGLVMVGAIGWNSEDGTIRLWKLPRD